MGVWYRTIATSASAALTVCLVMAGDVVAAPAVSRSTTPESEIRVDDIPGSESQSPTTADATDQSVVEIAEDLGASVITEPVALVPQTAVEPEPGVVPVQAEDEEIAEEDLDRNDADAGEQEEIAEEGSGGDDADADEVAIAPAPLETNPMETELAEAKLTETEPADDAQQLPASVGITAQVPPPMEPLPVETLDADTSDDGVPTADILQGGDLTPLEPNPNPLQYPTLPEEVRLVLRQPITLAQALELARRNSRVLENARLTLEQNQHGLRAAIAARYPQLNLTGNLVNSLAASTRLNLLQTNRATRRAGGTDLVEDPADRNADSTNYNLTLQLSYNIYSSGQRLNRIRAARAQVKSAEYALEATFEEVRFSVTNAYYALQQEAEQLRIDQASVGFRERSVKDAKSLETAGLGTRFEVLQAEVELANDRQLVEQTRSRLLQARRELARQLSLPEVIDIDAADSVEKVGDWTLGLEESIIAAYRNRAELAQQLAQRDVAEAQRRALLAQDGPQLDAVLQYELLDSLDPKDAFGPVYGYSAALQFSWNIFDGGGDRARAAQQDALRRQAENQFATQREAVRFDVEQSYADLIANEASIRTALQAIKAAEEEVRLARLRFTAGVGTQTDRLNAETRFIRARGNVLAAIIGYNRAVSSLIRSVSNVAPGTVVPPRETVTLPELDESLGLDTVPSGTPTFDVEGDRIPFDDGELFDNSAGDAGEAAE